MREETKLQLALLGIKFEIKDVAFADVNWEKFITDASNNRILLYCSKEIVRLDLDAPFSLKKGFANIIIPRGEEYILKTRRALDYLEEKLVRIPFLVCKTRKEVDYVTFDVDILFRKKDYKKALLFLRKLGGHYVDCEKKLQGDIIMDGMIRMDMHDDFHWQQSDFIDVDKIWERAEKSTVFGVELDTPCLEDEVSLTLLNLIYERHYIPLIDYHFILKYRDKINWSVVFDTARKFKWDHALKMILYKLNIMHYSLFDEPLIHTEALIGKGFSKDDFKAPFIFSYKEGLIVFGERLVKCRYIKMYEFLYFFFAKTRFHLLAGKKVPVYGHWIQYKELGI